MKTITMSPLSFPDLISPEEASYLTTKFISGKGPSVHKTNYRIEKGREFTLKRKLGKKKNISEEWAKDSTLLENFL